MDVNARRMARDIVDAIEKDIRAVKRDRWGDVMGTGASGDPTARIDAVAEEAAIRVIDEVGEVNVLSEECGFISKGSDHTLILDPIDGTENAIRGIPFYAISIAIGRSGGGLAGVEYALVYNLATHDTYEARGQEALFNGAPFDSKPARRQRLAFSVQGPCPPLGGMRYKRRCLGAASLEIVLVAQGALDGYCNLGGKLRTTDVAAAALILRATGGEIYGGDGKALEMSIDSNERGGVLALRDRKMIDQFGAWA